MLQMKAMLDQIVANLPSGMGTQMHIKKLDERNFRDLGKFEGQGRSLEGVVAEVHGEDQGALHDFVQ